jgi:hypothetical protein
LELTLRIRPGTWGATTEGIGHRPTPSTTEDSNE